MSASSLTSLVSSKDSSVKDSTLSVISIGFSTTVSGLRSTTSFSNVVTSSFLVGFVLVFLSETISLFVSCSGSCFFDISKKLICIFNLVVKAQML